MPRKGVRLPQGLNTAALILFGLGFHVSSCLFAFRLAHVAEARRIRVWFLVVVIWLLVVPQLQARFMRRFLAIEAFVVPTRAMKATILPGDRMLSDKLAYGIPNPFGRGEIWRYADPGRGDVVLYWGPDSENVFAKRVIGLPGETIEIVEDIVLIDGVQLEEPYLAHGPGARRQEWSDLLVATKIPDGHYFMLGDYRRYSRDSRDPDHGPVPREAIIGRAGTIFYSRFGPDGEIRWSRIGRHVR